MGVSHFGTVYSQNRDLELQNTQKYAYSEISFCVALRDLQIYSGLFSFCSFDRINTRQLVVNSHLSD